MQLNRTAHHKPIRALLGCALLALATAASFLWLEVGYSKASENLFGAPAGTSSARAEASKVKSLDELMQMRITKVKGKKVLAKGSATGTVEGKVSFSLVLANASRGVATFYGHNSHGTITGTGRGKYRVAGAITYFSGKVTGLSGTGRYAHAKNRGLTVSGTVNRKAYKMTMRLRGKWNV